MKPAVRAVSLLVPVVLLLGSRDASAAGAASFSTSLGLIAALLGVLALQAGSVKLVAGSLLAVLVVVVALLSAVQMLRRRRRGWQVALPASSLSTPARDEAALVSMARERFIELQRAWDAADIDALRELTTPEMLHELVAHLDERGLAPNRTDVLELDARLVSLDHIGPLELASLEFSGIVRESAERGAVPFREVWMLARSREHDDRWRLARQQALL
jgi:Tim44-like domain